MEIKSVQTDLAGKVRYIVNIRDGEDIILKYDNEVDNEVVFSDAKNIIESKIDEISESDMSDEEKFEIINNYINNENE